MYLVTYLLGIIATFFAFVILNATAKPGEEISMPAAVISSIIWPVSMTVGLLAGAFNAIKKIYQRFF